MAHNNDNNEATADVSIQNDVSQEPDFDSYMIYLDGCDDTEDLQKYRPSGLHPIELGTRLDDRYEVRHKLGARGFATVWLAFDRQHKENVAMKIYTAEYTQFVQEYEIHEF